ncbi:MAG TPA: ABC transporter ATP-binding protein [Terriglobia bacterium]|nr:ABC transporter ATP-binding protein [Terriglobia bacterium]
MSDIALEFDGVWKKFKKGEIHDSLRDLVPAFTRGVFSRNHRGELAEREFWALRDVNFEVRRGEALGIIGANGAGKSTILKLLSRIMRPSRGRIRVGGRVSCLIEVGAGFHPDLTGRENVYLSGSILGMKRQEIARKFDEIVEFAGIGDFIDTPVKRYSNGMYARLGFAVAAHVDPDVLLVDEVLSVGDISFQKRCFDKMREKVDSGVAVIFVSHNLQAIMSLCKRCMVMAQGTNVHDGSSEGAVDAYVRASNEIGVADRETNAKFRVAGVEWLEPSGSSSPVIHPGSRCRLMVKFECLDDGPPFCAGFVVRRTRDLLYCYGASTAGLEQPLIECRKGSVMTIVYTFVNNFLRGHYRIDVNLLDRRRAEFLSQADGVANFTVNERVSYDGVVDVNLGVDVLPGDAEPLDASRLVLDPNP